MWVWLDREREYHKIRISYAVVVLLEYYLYSGVTQLMYLGDREIYVYIYRGDLFGYWEGV